MPAMTRRQVLTVAGATTLVALSGCGGSGSKGTQSLSDKRVGAMEDYGVGTTFKATTPLTFPILMLSNPGYPYQSDWMFLSELTERTNVSFDPTVVPYSDYNQKRSVMLGAGNAPMIIPKTYHPDEEAFIASGSILPVSDYLDLLPNFQDTVTKWNLQGDLDQFVQSDGKFYLLPGLHEDVWTDYSLAMRTDVLKALNLEVPTTWDEVADVLRAMKAAHPDSYPLSDRWSVPPSPGANNLVRLVSEAYGTWAGWDYQNAYFDTGKGAFVFTGAMEQYKQMLQYLNTLVSEELIDPLSFTQTDDQAIRKLANGQSFVISANAQEVVNSYRKVLADVPGATIEKIPVPMGPLGAVKQGTRLENGVMISSKAKDSENFVAMMQFIDWLWYSPEGKLFAKWGIEGTTYTGNVDDGTFALMPDVDWAGLNPSGTKNLQVEYGFFNGVFAYGGSTRLLNSQFPAEELAFQEVMNARETLPVPPPHPLTPEEREQATLWESGLKDYVNQQTLKFILGQRPLSEWDAYVSELDGKHMTEYIDMINKSYQRFKSARS